MNSKMLSIGLLIDHIYFSTPGGIGCYTENLLKNIFQIRKKEVLKLVHTHRSNKGKEFQSLMTGNDKIIKVPITHPLIYLLWHRFKWPSLELSTGPLDVVHAPFLIAPITKAHLVVTIHDLSFLRYPGFYGKWAYNFHKQALQRVAQTASKIISVSYSTKEDILKFTDIPEHKIKVIYEGVRSQFHPSNDLGISKAALLKYKLFKKYILFVGTLEPRKNLLRLIKAYSKVLQSGVNQYQLVIVGRRGWLYEDIFNKVTELKLEKEVVFLSNVSNEDIPVLMGNAALFVYPSLFEGFGLPLLEAMACGTPVITSNTGSLPEVIGDAGILVEPTDVELLAKNIYNTLIDQGFHQRLREKGIEQAKKFTWSKTAEETLAVYHDSIDNR